MKSLPDSRYSVSLEYCGHREMRFVARFCGEWLGQEEKEERAVNLARNHRAEFLRFWRK